MALSVEEILTSLGIPAESYAGKGDTLKEWNGKISASETAGAAALSAAEKKVADAQALSRVIDDNIAQFGVNETNIAQLRANNAALTAALEEVKKAGFTGINIPDLPQPGTNKTVDPNDQFRDNVTKGFVQMGQAMNAINRFYRVMGKPLPEDPTQLADNAARMRLSVNDYVEQTYKLSETERTNNAAAEQKRMDDYAATKLQEYKEKNPSVAGHPDLNGGMPSNYPAMPKPREAKDIRQFSSMSTRDKISSAMSRATEAAASRSQA